MDGVVHQIPATLQVSRPPSASGGASCDNQFVPRVKDLEDQLAYTEQQLRLLQQISRIMVRPGTLGAGLSEVVALAVDFMRADSCLLYLLEGDDLVLCASQHGPKGELPSIPVQADGIVQIRLKMDEGLTGWVARERRLLTISREAFLDPRFKLFPNLEEDTYDAFLSAPIILRGDVVGVINVQHRQPHFHTGGEMELLTTIGEQVGCLVGLAASDLTDIRPAALLNLNEPVKSA